MSEQNETPEAHLPDDTEGHVQHKAPVERDDSQDDDTQGHVQH